MVVDKFHEIISFKQSKWLEKYIIFNTQKRNKAKTDFEKDFHKSLNSSFNGKTVENVRNRVIEIITKDDNDKIFKQQSKLLFNGIRKSYTNYDSYTFKQNEILMDEPIYLGFAVLELSKLLMYGTFYDTLQPFFGEKNIQLHYTDSVAKDTNFLKNNENIKILRVDENFNEEAWYQEDNVITHWE